jgi:hypothetical protein
VNAIHPIAHVYDGFFIHSRGGINLPVAPPDIALPGTAAIRADLDVPVLTFETETDLTPLQYLSARQQEDSKNFRLWEVAGTAHYDAYGLGVGNTDLGHDPNVAALVVTTDPIPGLIHCDTPINSGPQHWVANAGLAALIKWVRTGKAPKSAPRLDARAGPPAVINRDANGNALGGIRTPQVDVPIATFTGQQSGGSILCLIFGTTTPFDAPTLATLYPTHKAFVAKYHRALTRAVKKRWLLKADAKLIKKWAADSGIGG